MEKNILSFLSILSLFGILLMLNYTGPLDAGVVGVLVFFTMIFTFWFGFFVNIVKIVQKILRDKKGKLADANFKCNNRTYMYSVILAFCPILLLITIRTRGELDLVSTVGVFVLVLLECFWVYKKA